MAQHWSLTSGNACKQCDPFLAVKPGDKPENWLAQGCRKIICRASAGDCLIGKCFPLSLASAVGSVVSYCTELWFLCRFSDFIPIISFDFLVFFCKSPKISDNKRSNTQASEEDLPAILSVIVHLFWCALMLLLKLISLLHCPHVIYQQPVRVDCNSEWIYFSPARQEYTSKLMQHKK